MKKIANVLLAALMGVSILLPVAGCKKKCNHNVGTWEVVTPATCTNTGIEEGVCGECLKTQQREIPVDPDAHVYGEWVVDAPTEKEEGKAVKPCTENGEHSIEATLPVLTSPLYLSQIVERPTAAKSGSRSYEIKHEAGNIKFTCEIPNTGVQSVLDAAGLGGSEESHQLVRRAEGTMNASFFRPWVLKEASASYGVNGYITSTYTGTEISQVTDVSYTTGGYSNKLTMAKSSATGGFTVNGNLVNTEFTKIESNKKENDVTAVRFVIYNGDTVDHSYEFYPQMTGERKARGYTGVLKAGEWTEALLYKDMWKEAANDPSKKYTLNSAVEVCLVNEGATGTGSISFYVDGFSDVYLSKQPAAHSYELGEDYTYILDGVKDSKGVISGGTDNCERWYFIEDEKTYGLTNYLGGGTQSKKITDDLSGSGQEDYIDGSRLYLQYADDVGTYFGVENLLEGLYRYACMSINNDFTQEAKEVEGKPVYAFSFGFINNSGDISGYFAKVSVEFTLTDNFVVDWIWAQAEVYVNNFGQVDDGGNPLPDVHTWDLDEEGYAYVLPGQENGERYLSTIEFTQTEKKAGEAAIKNPHSLKNIYVKDFTVFYKGQPVSETTAIPLAVTDGSAITNKSFSIGEVNPSAAFDTYDFDKLSFYLRTTVDGEVVDTPLSYNTSTTIAVHEEDGMFGFNSKLSGRQTIVLKTRDVEKIILCDFSTKAPSALNAKGYLYNKTTKQYSNWTSVSNVNGHYVGQPFYFTAEVPEGEKGYVAGNFTFTVKKVVNPADEATWTTVTEGLGNAFMGGKTAEAFTPSETGAYKIYIAAELGSATCTITLNVEEAPLFSDLAATGREYEGQLEFSQTRVEVAFSNLVELPGGAGYTVTATIVKFESGSAQASASEQLSCTYAKGEISGVWELTSSHAGGAKLDYKLSMNECYDFIVVHKYLPDPAFPEFAEDEECVLKETA